jgi:hypothetical protein
MKTRLDPVEKLRNDAEMAARRRLSGALTELNAAHGDLETAAAAAAATPVGTGDAWLIEIVDRAHGVSLAKLRLAEEAVAEAVAAADAAHAAHAYARRSARVITRVIEERKLVMRQEEDRKEQRELDDLALRA